MLKVELHTHTADDPVDPIPHTTCELIDRAAALGYDALAVTLHDHELNLDPWKAYAEARGIVLIHGIERTIKGRHVLLLNFPRGAAERVTTFEDLARLKRSASGLVVAPHPFFPGTTSLWSRLEQHADLFDAVERNAMFTTRSRLQSRRRTMGAAPRQADGRERRRPPAGAARNDLFAGRRDPAAPRCHLRRHRGRTRVCNQPAPVAAHGGTHHRLDVVRETTVVVRRRARGTSRQPLGAGGTAASVAGRAQPSPSQGPSGAG